MPMSAFGRSRWFGDDEEAGPTPLFPPGVIGTDKQSMFPVKSDASPVLGALKSGWKGLGDWLQAPADSQAGAGGELLGYKPTSHLSAIGDALTGAAKGVMGARGPYANWIGSGAVGATEGLEASRKQDLELRKLAQEQQYKQAELSLKRLEATRKDTKDRYLTGKSGDVIYDTQAPGGTPTIMAQIPDTTTINGQLVDKRTGERIGAAVPNQPTTIEGAAVNALAPEGKLPGEAAKGYFGAKLAEMTKPVAAQNTINPAFQIGSGQTKYQEVKGENAAKTLAEYNGAADAAQSSLNTVAMMRGMQGAVTTGAGEETLLPLRRALVAAGWGDEKDAAKLGGQEAFQALAKQNVKQMLGGKLGAGVSDSDVGFASRMSAELGNEPGANHAILDVQERLAQRALQVSDLAAQWDHENEARGGLMGRDAQGRTWRQAANDWAREHPLFDKEFQAQVQERLKAGKAAAPADKPDYAGSGY